MNCKICNVPFTNQNDRIYLCKQKDGFVHNGCCTDLCSWNKTPCIHKVAEFAKVK